MVPNAVGGGLGEAPHERPLAGADFERRLERRVLHGGRSSKLRDEPVTIERRHALADVGECGHESDNRV